MNFWRCVKMAKNEVVISLTEYKEMLLKSKENISPIEKILLERIIDYIKEKAVWEKDYYDRYRINFKNFKENDLIDLIKYVDPITYQDIYKYVSDESYKKQCDELKMERLRALKDLKKEQEKGE